jgi:hypothetical protein
MGREFELGGIDIVQLMSKSCWGIGCHSAGLPAASLDLESPGLRERLVDVPASHGDIIDGTASPYAHAR